MCDSTQEDGAMTDDDRITLWSLFREKYINTGVIETQIINYSGDCVYVFVIKIRNSTLHLQKEGLAFISFEENYSYMKKKYLQKHF